MSSNPLVAHEKPQETYLKYGNITEKYIPNVVKSALKN
jgi:hypothetical protein